MQIMEHAGGHVRAALARRTYALVSVPLVYEELPTVRAARWTVPPTRQTVRPWVAPPVVCSNPPCSVVQAHHKFGSCGQYALRAYFSTTCLRAHWKAVPGHRVTCGREDPPTAFGAADARAAALRAQHTASRTHCKLQLRLPHLRCVLLVDAPPTAAMVIWIEDASAEGALVHAKCSVIDHIPVATGLKRCKEASQGAPQAGGGASFADKQSTAVGALLKAYARADGTGVTPRFMPAVACTRHVAMAYVPAAVDMQEIREERMRLRAMGVPERKAYLLALKSELDRHLASNMHVVALLDLNSPFILL